MTGRQTRAVIVGASTMLGKELADELNNSPAAAWDTRLLDESAEAETQLTAAGDEAAVIQPLTSEALAVADIVFFAGQSATTREHWRSVAARGASIVDLTGTLEGEPGFLLRCAWVAGGTKPDLTTAGLVSAHPAALMLALALDRLARFGVSSLSATILEPASEAGQVGLDELHQQTVGLLSFQSVPKEIFDTQVAFNLQASLGESSRVQLSAVRDTVRRHVKAVMGTNTQSKLHLQVVQAPVFHGYTISALGEFANDVREDQLLKALNGGVVLAEEDTAPSNLAATEIGDLLVAVDSEGEGSGGTAHWLWMAADNLRLAARNAVAAGMELAALRPTEHVQ